MRIRPVITSVVASLAILGIGWRVGETEAEAFKISLPETTPKNATTASATASSSPSASTATSSTTSPSATASKTATPSASATTNTINGVYTGDAVQTPYGTVQVKVTVKSSKVVSVGVVQLTSNDGRSQQIDAYAEPILTSEANKAGSANISAVSGATYTSQGYIQSLQSAIDKAGV